MLSLLSEKMSTFAIKNLSCLPNESNDMEVKSHKNNTLLTAYLNEYIKMQKPQFAVMITGKWGCGKTYYINRVINEWRNEKVKTSKDSIILKPIYVSIYGMHSISEIIHQIRVKLKPILYSKGVKVAKQAVLTTLQIFTKSKVDFDGDGTGEDLNNFLDAEGILEIFKSESLSIKGNKVLVFDDLERSHIPMDEFFGFVNSIVEHSNSKVILLCEEDKLKESAEKDKLKVEYKDFKEKLVGHTFSLEVDYSQIVTSFINDSKNKILTDNRDLIVKLFEASKYKNLRIIKHSLLDIVRLFNQFPTEIEKNVNYAFFAKNVVAYFVIASIEDRFGNKDIDNFQSVNIFNQASEKTTNIENKYYTTLEFHKLYHSTYTIPIKTLLSFVRTGFFNEPEKVVAECRLLQSKNMTNWERLWRYEALSNDEFMCLLTSERERFYKKEMEYSFEVAHVAGILLALEKRDLVKLSRKYVVSIAKKNIEKIYSNYPNDVARLMLNRYGYEFHESDSIEMKEIFDFVAYLMQKQIANIEREYIVKAWEQLKTGMTSSEIEALFDQPTPTRRCKYSMESIFAQVNPRAMADKIIALSNATKVEFMYFLINRYYIKGSKIKGTLTDEMKMDKESLKNISNILKSKSKRLRLIDKVQIMQIAYKMDDAIAKM